MEILLDRDLKRISEDTQPVRRFQSQKRISLQQYHNNQKILKTPYRSLMITIVPCPVLQILRYTDNEQNPIGSS